MFVEDRATYGQRIGHISFEDAILQVLVDGRAKHISTIYPEMQARIGMNVTPETFVAVLTQLKGHGRIIRQQPQVYRKAP